MVSYVKGIKRMFTDAFHETILKFNSVYAIRLFYPIGTGDNRGAMSLGEFAAKKIGTEKVSIDDKTYSCIKISLVLTMFSWAWTGLFWVDTATGQVVQSGVKKGNKEKPEWQLNELTYKK